MFLLPVTLVATLLSAGLLFLVQPMFARMALPLFGGSPQVWISCMLFFQLTLLAGYAYSHWLGAQRILARQLAIHALALGAPLLFLPIGIDPDFAPDVESSQSFQLLGVLAWTIGVPFFAVSTTGPLLQRWFSHSAHPQAHDPYFLYAAGNAGSLLGLLAYPLLLEPRLSLAAQGQTWSVAYGFLILLCLASGLLVLRHTGPGNGNTGTGTASCTPISWRRRLRWIVLAFVPSSLMLGVTTHITTEVAVAPLLWVIPLSLYLISFVLVFSVRNPLRHEWLVRVLPPAALLLMMLLVTGTNKPVALALAVSLGFFFIAAMVCHGELSRDRPPASQLTLFYLLLAIGGALGGVFNALLSPVLFDSIAEFPIAVILACLLCPPRTALTLASPLWKDVLPALAIAALVAVLWGTAVPLTRLVGLGGPQFDLIRTLLVVALPLVACYLLVSHPRRFALALAAWSLAGFAVYEHTRGDLLYAERSFFGVSRVNIHPGYQARVLRHGYTAHGMQKLAPELRGVATTYYHASGPAGQVFAAFGEHLKQVGIIGLGAGTQAVYAGPGQQFVYFEIDPVVVEVAQNPELFSFVADARSRGARVDIHPGDARLSLAAEPDDRYDLLIVDAFTNDAIPVHLMTREALGLYLEKIRPDGLLLVHVSNEHLAVYRPLSDLAADAGLFALYQDNPIENAQQAEQGKFRSQWVLMARNRSLLEPLGASARRWGILPAAGERIWTDDYSNIIGLMLARP